MSQFIAVTKPGCPACENVKPELAKAGPKIAKKVTFAHVNADEHPSALEKYEVEAFPDFVYQTKSGEVHHMPWTGPPKVDQLVAWLESVRKGKSLAQQHVTDRNCSKCGVDGHGVSPKLWGPPLWFVIHMVALTYPRTPTPSQRAEMIAFFQGLADVLPCDYCQKHYAKEMSTMDLSAFASRDTLFAWTVAFHDSVSDRTHSTQPRHSERYWRNYYKQMAYSAIKARKAQRKQRI